MHGAERYGKLFREMERKDIIIRPAYALAGTSLMFKEIVLKPSGHLGRWGGGLPRLYIPIRSGE
jgi:hypothetical protein